MRRLRPAEPETQRRATKASAPARASKSAGKKPAAKPVAASVPADKAGRNVKPKKTRLIRDSFTMPEIEYQLIAAVKRRCLDNGSAVKKSEVLRAAVIAFAARSDAAIARDLRALTAIKTGRPPKEQK